MPESPAQRLLSGPSRNLRAQDAGGYARRSLVLPREPHDLQPAARLSGGAPAGHARCAGSGVGVALRRMTTSGLPGAIRWVRRRLKLVHNALARVIGLIPDKLALCAATMIAVRERLKCDSALMELRGLAAGQLQTMPAPLGFQPHGNRREKSRIRVPTTEGARPAAGQCVA